MLNYDSSNMEDVSDSETDDEIVKIKKKQRNKNTNSNKNPEPEPTNNKTPVKKKRAIAILDSSDDDEEEDNVNGEDKSSEDNHKNTDSGNVEGATTDKHNKIFNKSNAIFSTSEEEDDDIDDLGLRTPVGSDQSFDLQLSPAINLNTPKLNLPRSKLANSPTLASSTDSSPKNDQTSENKKNASTIKNNSENNKNTSKNSDSSATESNKDLDSDSNSGSDDDELDGLRLFRNKNAEISTAAPRKPEKNDKKLTGVNKKQKINAQGLADSSDDEGASYFGDVSRNNFKIRSHLFFKHNLSKYSRNRLSFL